MRRYEGKMCSQITLSNLILDFHHHPVVLCQFKLNAMHEVLPFVSSKILMVQLESLSLVAEKITKLTPLTSPSKLEKEWAGGILSSSL